MTIIASLDQHQLGFFATNDTKIQFTRRAARAIVFDEKDRVAIMYFSKTGSYKLPGGGIDEGESIDDALHREIREETGYKIANIRELGVVEEDRYYAGMHQTSYCFVATAEHYVGTDLTDKERAEGMELRWLDTIEQAIAAVKNNSLVDEEGDKIGHEMMKLREVAILEALHLSTKQTSL